MQSLEFRTGCDYAGFSFLSFFFFFIGSCTAASGGQMMDAHARACAKKGSSEADVTRLLEEAWLGSAAAERNMTWG